MDKNLFTVSSLLFLFALPVWGQQTDGTAQSSNIYGNGFNARAQEIPYTPGETRGSYYLFNHWSPGTITMRNGEEVQDMFLKYDFQNHSLEIKTDSAYYALPAVDTKYFSIYDDEQNDFRRFVAAQDYHLGDTPLVGALEMHYEGRLSLLSRTASKLIEANYAGALSGGSKSDKIVKEREYFLAEQEQVTPLPTKKKEAIEMLRTYNPEIKNFVKKNRLKPKRQEDLVLIIEHLNQEKR
jgi:hypothetical protein